MTTKKKTSKKTKEVPAISDGDGDDAPDAAPEFEKALAKLDTIVERMEEGEQSLEQSIKDFEEGMKLARLCETHLKTAEARVDKLMSTSVDAETELFEHEA